MVRKTCARGFNLPIGSILCGCEGELGNRSVRSDFDVCKK